MKKSLMITAFLCLLSAFAYAQTPSYTSLTINNSTPCTVYMLLGGNTSGGACTPDQMSSVIAIAPGSTTFDAGGVPGGMGSLSSGDIFTFIELYTSQPTPSNMCAVIHAYNFDICAATTTTPPVGRTGVNFDNWNGATCNSCGTFDVSFTNSTSTNLIMDIQ